MVPLRLEANSTLLLIVSPRCLTMIPSLAYLASAQSCTNCLRFQYDQPSEAPTFAFDAAAVESKSPPAVVQAFVPSYLFQVTPVVHERVRRCTSTVVTLLEDFAWA